MPLRWATVAAFAGLLLAISPLVFEGTLLARENLRAGSTAVVHGTQGHGLRVRQGPGLGYEILTVLPEGTKIQILAGPVSDGEHSWYQIRYSGDGSGWGVEQYLASAEVTAEGGVPGARSFQARISAYADGADGGAVGSVTSTGTRTRWGVVAVDPRFIPLGSRLLIEGLDGVFVAEDTGSAIKGPRIDVWFPDVIQALRFGIQYRQVTVLPPEEEEE